MKRRRVARAASLLLLSLLGATAAAQGPLPVFVSIPPQAYLLQRLGGERLQVSVLLTPGQAPETFDPTPQQMRELSAARLYFLAGVPFETTWGAVLQRAYPALRVVPCCAGAARAADAPDPHFWTSPANTMRMAQDMCAHLVQADPAGAADYRANLQRLLADLRDLDAYIRTRLQQRHTNVFITAHAAWGWLARDYGLQELSLEKNGREIGPRGLTTLVQTAQREGIHTVFVQAQFHTPVVDALARQLQARLVVLDPLAGDYIANMTRVADRLAEALQ